MSTGIQTKSNWYDQLERKAAQRMYAISFDLDTQILQETYGSESWRNAYYEIKQALAEFGFNWQQGSVYFGNENVTSITCLQATQGLVRRFDWFAPSVRDIRMLRIEEQNDLRSVIDDEVRQRGTR
jgi:virulence-associated protein VapD